MTEAKTARNGGDGAEAAAEESVFRRRVLPLLMLLVVVAISASLFVFQERVAELGDSAGYLGAFLISLVANGTVILPMPGNLLLFALGAAFNPWLIGLAAAAGGAIGELTGYAAGYSGRGIWRNNQTYTKAVGWVERRGSWVVLLFAATPLPVDVIGIAAGALRFPVWKFVLVCFVGKTILYTAMALAGAWGWELVVGVRWDTTVLWISGVAAVVVVALLFLGLKIRKRTRSRER